MKRKARSVSGKAQPIDLAGGFKAFVSRPAMPTGYGLTQSRAGMLSWNWVQTRLKSSRNYWLGTTRPDQLPHCRPVWGVWLDHVLYFGTDRSSRKAKNLQAIPRAVVHLESGDEAVIVDGVAAEISQRPLLKRIDQAYRRKYQMNLSDAPGELVVYGISPKVVQAWREKDFPVSATRWTVKK